MANEMTVKREVLYLGHEKNVIAGKNGADDIKYITVDLIDKHSRCKINCSFKCKIEEFDLLGLEEYETYEAELIFTFADKIKCKCLSIN